MAPPPRSQRITSRGNPRVAATARLRDRAARKERGLFLIDGLREVERALQSGIEPAELFVCDELVHTPEGRQVVARLRQTVAEVFDVSADVYGKIAFGQREDGVVLVARTPLRPLAELHLPPQPLVAVLEGLEKPGNIGAILRTADAAGVDAVVVADGRTDLFNPNAIRASLGTIFRPNVREATSAETIEWLRGLGIPLLAARPDATQLYTAVDLSRGAAFVLGSEAHGLSPAWNAAGITPIRLPMHGLADSLNVSTTAAVLFYEAVRQRARDRE
ncbi:MAG: RNA methyltransferase [Pirellulales bacterium]|nr:RNA methyltransferase [Pirellulales bacterium]